MESSINLKGSIPRHFEQYPWFCAVSGGADSVALLYLLRQAYPQKDITVVYIDHNWSSQSCQWEKIVKSHAQSLSLPFASYSVDDSVQSEGTARALRLSLYQKLLNKPGLIFLGHHLDDQIETSLWRWIRGNWQSLDSMRFLTKCSQGFLVRPLLDLSKNRLLTYLHQHEIDFVQDPSNKDIRHTRNFLRHEILPKVINRESGIKSSFLQARQRFICERSFLKSLFSPYMKNILHWRSYPKIDEQSLTLLITHWLDYKELPHPSYKSLKEFASQCIKAHPQKHPSLELLDYVIYSYRGLLYSVEKESLSLVYPKRLEVDSDVVSWGDRCFKKQKGSLIGSDNRVWVFTQPKKRQTLITEQYPNGIRVSQLWKELLIPPWMRKSYPLITVDGKFVQLGDLCYCPEFKKSGEIFTHERI